jgi:hypothetical protein
VGSGGIGGGSSTVDLTNYYTKDETDTKFATVETVSSKAETSQITDLSTRLTTLSTKVDSKAEVSQVETLNTTFTSALASKASTADVQALQTTVSEV